MPSIASPRDAATATVFTTVARSGPLEGLSIVGFSMGDPLHMRQARGVLETVRQCASPPHGNAKEPRRAAVISPRWRKDRGAAGDKIVGPATIERAADMVEAAEEDSGLYGRGVLSG